MAKQPAPAAWYVDPLDRSRWRWFDGSTWTDHVAPAPPSVPVALEDDLATNRPGAAARAKALELRRAAPVRSRLGRVMGAQTSERPWRVGAAGEKEVARRLKNLGPGWHVLHAVPVGERGSDIDHVVVGPPGVFTLNTKNHSGKKVWVAEHAFLVSGQKQDYLRNSRFEARRAGHLLSAACGLEIRVQPVIVVLAESLTVKAQPADVHVVARKQIVRWLRQRPTTLTPEGVGEIFGRARVTTTWQPRDRGH